MRSAAELLREIPRLAPGDPLFIPEGPVHPFTWIYDAEAEWARLLDPFTGARPRGIRALGAVGRHEGVTTVLGFVAPSPEAARATEMLHGTPVVYVGGHPAGAPPRQLGGLALHPGNTFRSANGARARVNPHLGYGRLHGSLDKWTEYLFTESVQPGIMGRTLRLCDLPGLDDAPFAALREQVRAGLARARGALDAGEEAALRRLFRAQWDAVRRAFPAGAQIKHVLGCGTGDRATAITDAADPDALVSRYLAALDRCAREEAAALASEEALSLHLVGRPDVPGMVVHDSVTRPHRVIAQETLALARTALGEPLEFRVDFIDGEPLGSHLRMTGELYPEEGRRCARALHDLFARAPRSHRYLCGGADVALGADGRPRIIELNFGAESSFMKAGVFANVYASRILGRPTPLLALLEELFHTPLATQRAFLEGIEATALAHPEADATYGVSYWLRERHLDAWDQHPDPGAAEVTRAALRSLCAVRSPGDDKDRADIDQLLLGAEDYLARRLKG